MADKAYENGSAMSSQLEFSRNGLRSRTPAHRLVCLFSILMLVAAPALVGAQAVNYAYFTVSPDPRLCPAPTCGGFQLRAVNQDTTTCADGSQQASCYVASADFGALETPPGFAPGEVVVRGRLAADEYPGFGNLGRLVAESAWTGATRQAAQGTFLRIRDRGIVCVTSPCFSIEGRVLNKKKILPLSSLDLDAVDATPAQLAAAQAAVQRGDLLVTGTFGPDPGPAGEGLALIASQFWLPEPANTRCVSEADCSAGERCNAAEVCLPLPECEPGDPCPAVCSGYCETSACTINADCDASEYCASDGLCRSDGTCGLEVDCSLPGNDYPHIECVGHGTCDMASSCGWECTNPMCVDLLGYGFGPCDAVLGWGVVSGACVEVSGCDPEPFELFASRDACEAACPAQPVPVPLLGLRGVLVLGLGLSCLTVAFSRRSTTVAARRDTR